MKPLSLLYIPEESKRVAKKLAKVLLQDRLVACVHIIPISSMYWWNGKIEDANECVLLCKTTKELAGKVEAQVLKLHSYDVPCILQTEVKVNDSYYTWVESVTQK